jgi:hypothetical protein
MEILNFPNRVSFWYVAHDINFLLCRYWQHAILQGYLPHAILQGYHGGRHFAWTPAHQPEHIGV